jgi:hypothetical protein
MTETTLHAINVIGAVISRTTAESSNRWPGSSNFGPFMLSKKRLGNEVEIYFLLIADRQFGGNLTRRSRICGEIFFDAA